MRKENELLYRAKNTLPPRNQTFATTDALRTRYPSSTSPNSPSPPPHSPLNPFPNTPPTNSLPRTTLPQIPLDSHLLRNLYHLRIPTISKSKFPRGRRQEGRGRADQDEASDTGDLLACVRTTGHRWDMFCKVLDEEGDKKKKKGGGGGVRGGRVGAHSHCASDGAYAVSAAAELFSESNAMWGKALKRNIKAFFGRRVGNRAAVVAKISSLL
ncbi:hypothetical protein K432DRAFT_30381 [Lepidopterella palustris CBS 459.81]|uniref:Uncharacterized protein n=1 Tax=Lepidopterella palustris CBS 459.81 TaxID=1314670 RepID=A0A8E2EBV1_9PEZI|nr:hypothetical protein K432DRAFT_30381 [Lepidopterella palustris CBS 459.81]